MKKLSWLKTFCTVLEFGQTFAEIEKLYIHKYRKAFNVIVE